MCTLRRNGSIGTFALHCLGVAIQDTARFGVLTDPSCTQFYSADINKWWSDWHAPQAEPYRRLLIVLYDTAYKNAAVYREGLEEQRAWRLTYLGEPLMVWLLEQCVAPLLVFKQVLMVLAW